MRVFQATAEIGATAERAFALLADVERWPEWTASVTRVERLTSGEFGLGARVRVHQPRLRPLVWTVTIWEPGRGFTWTGRSPGLRVVGVHALAPAGPACRLTLELRYEGLLGGLVGLLAAGITRRYLALEAEGLRARCERPG